MQAGGSVILTDSEWVKGTPALSIPVHEKQRSTLISLA